MLVAICAIYRVSFDFPNPHLICLNSNFLFFFILKIVHVECAHKAGYVLGFEIQPVKGSRRDLVSTVKVGSENGSMSAVLWCPNHELKSNVHQIYEKTDETGQVRVFKYLLLILLLICP